MNFNIANRNFLVTLAVAFAVAFAASPVPAQARSAASRAASVPQAPAAGALGARKPGDTVKVLFSRRGGVREIELTLGTETKPSCKILPLAAPTAQQKALLDGWLR